MSKIASRLLVFFIGIPLVLLIVFFDCYYHLPMQLALILFSALGAAEFYDMAASRFTLFWKPLVIVFSALLPAASYVLQLFYADSEVILWLFTGEAVVLMTIESVAAKSFEKSVPKIAVSLFIIFYCGFMLTFISRMTVFANSVYVLALYFIFVFMCDSAAWFFGILFGKNNRGFIAASPNKSIAGFIGGIAGAVASGIIFRLVFSGIFTGEPWRMVVLALLTSCAGIVGDIIESVFKRSLGFKDSGKIIPGRGGVLDSIDSLITAAPVFYLGIYFLFEF